MVKERATDDKGIGEMETRHSGQLVDIRAANPDALGILLAHSILEAEGLGKESWRHAGVEREDDKGGEVSKRHGTAGNCKRVVRWRAVVEP